MAMDLLSTLLVVGGRIKYRLNIKIFFKVGGSYG